MSYFNKIQIKYFLIYKNYINNNVFYITGSNEIDMHDIIYEKNNYFTFMNSFYQSGGFFTTLNCPGRVFSKIIIIDSYSEKEVIGIKIIDQEAIQYSSLNQPNISIENSIFFNNLVSSLNFDKEHGVAIYMDTYITTNISNTIISVIK